MQTTTRIGRRRLLTLAGRTCYALYLAWLVVDAEDTVEQVMQTSAELGHRVLDRFAAPMTPEQKREAMHTSLVSRHEALLDAVLSPAKPVAVPSNFRALSPKASRSAE
jgi:hypothetical protein